MNFGTFLEVKELIRIYLIVLKELELNFGQKLMNIF